MDTTVKKTGIYSALKWIFAAAAAAGITISAKKLLGGDFNEFITWYLTLIILGISVFPLTGKLFKNFNDSGWLFAKTIGIAAAGWLMWYTSSIFLKFTRINCIIITALIFIVCMAVNILLHKKQSGVKNIEIFNEKRIFNAVCLELVFFALFLFWSYARGFKPEAYGTEKFMDYGFMTAMLRSEYMPPEDLWFANEPINYYYVGQFIAAFITKLSGLTANYGYNLMLMTLAAFGFALPFSLTYNITETAREYAEKRKQKFIPKAASVISAAAAGTAVCFTSNLHYPIYRWIIPWIKEKLGVEAGAAYWFPDATRYIGYNPSTNDKTIHEFPSYSFILGDLHAHVINIMFVITVLALLFAILQERKPRMSEIRETKKVKCFNFVKEVFNPTIIVIGFFIGLFHTTNFWDFPIYFVVAGAIILFSNAVLCGFTKITILLTAAHAVLVLAVSEAVCLPFTISFNKISSQIALCVNHTPLYQFMVLWGFPLVVVIVYMLVLYKDAVKEKTVKKLSDFWTIIPFAVFAVLVTALVSDIYGTDIKSSTPLKLMVSILIALYAAVLVYKKQESYRQESTNKNNAAGRSRVKAADNGGNGNNAVIKDGMIVRNKKMNWLFNVIETADISNLFIVTIALCAIGLIVMPEVVYVVDIYSGDYKRANTMFKLTYQSYIMFGICIGFILTKLLCETKKARKIFAVCGLFVLASLAGYSRQGFNSWYGDIKETKNYKGLDAAAFVKNESLADYYAVEWLNENVTGTPNILEANGSSYTYYNRISVFTGLPTVLGWNTHEWLWRSDKTGSYPACVAERAEDVKKIYTSADKDEVEELIRKYNIEYIYIGGCEYTEYKDELNIEQLLKMGETVFSYKADGEYRTSFLIRTNISGN